MIRKNTKKVNADVEYGYNFSMQKEGEGLDPRDESDKNLYDQVKYFYIDGPKEFGNFAQSVANGFEFTGKEVLLTTSIKFNYEIDYDDENEEWLKFQATTDKGFNAIGWGPYSDREVVFNGTFNGQTIKDGCEECHFLSNFEVTTQETSTASGNSVDNNGCGLFAILGPQAVVKNLKIEDATFTTRGLEFSGDTTGHVGAIAGVAMPGARIENCMVENITINVTKGVDYNGFYQVGKGTDSYVGSLIGAIYTPTGYGVAEPNHDRVFGDSPTFQTQITDCLIWGMKVNTSVVNYKGCHTIIGGYRAGSSTSCNITNVLMVETGTEYEDVPNADEIRTLSATHNKGLFNGFDYENIWYYKASLFNGYSMLRAFIDEFIVVINFTSENEIMGTVNQPQVEVLESVLDTFNPLQITPFAGVEVVATANGGYNFSSWRKVDDYNYKACFEREKYKLTFATTEIGGNVELGFYHSSAPSNNLGLQILNPAYKDKWYFEVEYHEDKTFLKFYDNSWTVIYKVGPKYTIDDNGLSLILDEDGCVKCLEEGETYIITPTVKLKEYEIQIK